MLNRVTLTNFKAHRLTTVDLGRLTLLVGANGVGKTSVLEALHWLSQLAYTTPRQLFQGPRDPAALVRNQDEPAVLLGEYTRDDGDPNKLRLTLTAGPLDDAKPVAELSPGGITITRNQTFLDVQKNHPFLREARSAVLFRLDARAVAKPGYVNSRDPRVEFDGSNTAAVLATWKLGDDDRLARTLAQLNQLIPQVRNVKAKPYYPTDRKDPEAEAASERANGYTLVFDFDDAADVPATSVSEGTLVALALLTALNAKAQPRLVLLDDLGAELHPQGQADLVDLLNRIIDENPKLQIVASTHSPYILDGTTPANVRVFARGKDGAAQVKRLDEHPDAARSGELTTGQLWTLDPESWVLEGSAAP